MIYFDNAATTPMSKTAMTAMTQVMENTFGNPSSIHNHGRAANKMLRKERQELADLLHTKSQHIIFTSGEKLRIPFTPASTRIVATS